MANLKILPIDKTIEVNEDTDLLTALKENDIAIKNSCGGCASCSHCVVVVKEGLDNINEISFEEKQVLGNVFHITSERLSCQTKITGDVTIDISSHGYSQATKQTVLKRTKEDVQKMREQRFADRKEKTKKLGGGKKPKAFSFNNTYNKESKGE
ncbi:MAG: (2Fe-2S)-binding protein [Bacteriovoracaceae bacterium]|jgi:ferredoxin|nr:(2Fe-2S)-binding protein [Bacteriovoracaceae bacterium]